MKRSTLLLLLAFSLVAVACPNVDPDKPKPTPAPTPAPTADSTTVSLSATRKITGSDIVGSELGQLLTVADDGAYALAFEGEPFPMNVDGLKNFDGGRPFRKYCNFPISYNFKLGQKPSLPTGAGSGQIDLSTVLPATVNLGSRAKGTALYVPALPEGMTSVESITLKESSRVQVTLSLVSTPFTGGTVTPSFSVDMRKFFESSDAEDGFLKFDAPLSKENGWSYTKNFRLTGAVFDPANYDASTRTLKIDARIGLSGKVAYENLTATRSSLSAAADEMLLNVTVVLYDVACESITGKFDYKSKDVTATLDMHALSAATAKTIDVSKASVRLEATNSMPLAAKAVSSLTARRNRRTLGKAEGLTTDVPAAAEGEVASASRTFAAEDGDIKALFAEAPDELVVTGYAQTDTSNTGTLRLDGGYVNTLRPSMYIPLAFNKNLSVEVRDTLAAPSQLKAALKKGAASLSGEVANTLPLAATMTVKLIADDGSVLSSEASMDVPAGASAPVALSLRNVAGDGIEKLSKAVVTFKLTGTDSSVRPLRQTDAIQAELKVKFANQ